MNAVMKALVAATQLYRSEHAGCPTVEDLMRMGIVERQARVVDDWDNPLEIVCTSDRSWVESAGPDEMRHTEDDIESRTSPASSDGWQWR